MVLGGGAVSYERGTPVHQDLPHGYQAMFGHLSVTYSVGAPLCPYGIACRGAQELLSGG